MNQIQILIINEEKTNTDFYESIFCDNERFTCRFSPSYPIALAMFDTFLPDIILIDTKSPKNSGYEICRNLRLLSQLDSITIIILSFETSEYDRLLGYKAGADDYFIKPFYPDELVAKVNAFTKFRRTTKKNNVQNDSVCDECNSIKQENRSLNLFNGSSSTMLLFDPFNLAIFDANQAAANFYGFTREEFSSMTLYDLDIMDKHKIKETIKNVLNHQETFLISKHCLENGDIRDVKLDVSLTSWDDKKLIFSIVHDITETKHIEDQLRHAQKMEAIGTLASGISHDFNNILTGILGLSKIARDEQQKKSPIYNDLDQIVAYAERASGLVNRILTFSRKSDNSLFPTSIHPIATESLKLLKAALPPNIELKHNISTDIGIIEADSNQIHQVIMNLCTNAYHAMESKGGILTITLQNVTHQQKITTTIPTMPPGDYVELTVIDNGHGITPQNLPNIFDPYYTSKTKGKGTGLGLAMVHGIVHNHRGHIGVESIVGKGSAFSIFLPMLETDNKADRLSLMPETEHGKGEHIIFVDDEKELAQLGKRFLDKIGYQVSHFTSSLTALQEFEQAPDKYDMLITDFVMPEIDGAELINRCIAINPLLPVILCSGNIDEKFQEKISSLKTKAFFKKPYSDVILAREISKIFDQSKAKQPHDKRKGFN